MDIISAYGRWAPVVGLGEIVGTTPKTVKRVIDRHEAGGSAPVRVVGGTTTTLWPSWWLRGWEKTAGRISAKRLLPAARAAGYAGSAYNFRRLVTAQKQLWRLMQRSRRGLRPSSDRAYRRREPTVSWWRACCARGLVTSSQTSRSIRADSHRIRHTHGDQTFRPEHRSE
jgi:hypothetical protein